MMGWRPWVFWGLAAVFYCYGFFQRVAPSVMVSDLMRDFAVGAAVLGNLSALYFYAYASLQLPVGLLLDHWGPRKMLTGAALLVGGGSLLFAAADNLWAAYAGRLLIGVGCGVTWVGALKLAAVWFPPRRFALVTGLTMLLGMAGAVGGQAPLAAAVEVMGWRGTLSIAGLFGLGLTAAILLIVRDAPAGTPPHDSSEHGGILAGLKLVLRRPQTWFVATFGAMMTTTLLGFAGLWSVPYMMVAYKLDRPAAALATSLFMIGWGIGAPVTGWISDHLGRRKPPMVAGATLGLTCVWALIYWPGGMPLSGAYVLLFLSGLFSVVMVLSFAAGREHNLPSTQGATLGFINMSVMATGAIFQPLIGWLLDVNWDGTLIDGARAYSLDAYKIALLTLPACNVTALIAALLVRETHCKPLELDPGQRAS